MVVMWFFSDRGVVIAAVIISLTCALGAGLFIHLSQQAVMRGLEERALDLAAMIADRAKNTDTEFSSLVELGKSIPLYLEVKLGEEVVVKSAERYENRLPPPSPAPTEPRSLRVNTPEGRGVAVFYPFQDPERGSGYVWLALAIPFHNRFGFLAGVVSAVALAVDLSALAVLSVWVRGRHGRGRPAHGKMRVGKLEIDREAKCAYLAGKKVRLTPKEFALLALLASSPGRVFSNQEILDVVWSDSRYADDKNVKQCIYSLRKKLRKEAPRWEKLIVTEPGFGYVLRPPED